MGAAVVFYSQTGNTRDAAGLVEQGLAAKGPHADLIEAAEFGPEMVADYDWFAFGCPASGSEELEASTFQPMWEAVRGPLAESGKPVALFGTWGWGEGEYLEEWEADAKAAGVDVVGVVSCEGDPDDEASVQLVELGEKLVS